MTSGWQIAGLAVFVVVLTGAPASETAAAKGQGSSGSTVKSGDRPSGRAPPARYHHRHRSRSEFGMLGGAVFWPWGDYPPYYPLADMPVAYVERGEQEAPATDHWLYCAKERGYFPAVGECADGWERVPAAPLR